MKKSMLLSTIAMIVVVVVALSTATFAWFTVSSTAAITSDFNVEATRDFIIKTYDTAWTITDQIDISSDKLRTVAPIAALDTATQVGKGSEGVDGAPVYNTNDAWYSVSTEGGAWKKDTFTGYTIAELTADSAALATVKPFQLALADSTATGTANFTIDLTINGQTLADFNAIKSVNVVLMIESYADSSVTYVGTQYNVQKTNTDGVADADVTVPGADATLASTPHEQYKAVTTTGLTADVSGSLETYKVDTTALKISYNGTCSFTAGEFKLVTAFIWLDGYQAADEIMGKVVTVNVGIAKA